MGEGVRQVSRVSVFQTGSGQKVFDFQTVVGAAILIFGRFLYKMKKGEYFVPI